MPFSSIYQEGVPSGAHSTRQGLLALTGRFFRLVLRKSLEACFKVKTINTCRNEQSSLFKWTILYYIAAIEHQKYRVLLIINSDMKSFLGG